MKRILRIGLLVAVALVGFSISGNAQVSRQYLVHIPFDFTVAKKHFKAGDYKIVPNSGATNFRTVTLQGRSINDWKVLGNVAIAYTESSDKGRLIFANVSDEWVLRNVETPGFSLKLKVPKTDEGVVATAGKPVETTTIGLNR